MSHSRKDPHSPPMDDRSSPLPLRHPRIIECPPPQDRKPQNYTCILHIVAYAYNHIRLLKVRKQHFFNNTIIMIDYVNPLDKTIFHPLPLQTSEVNFTLSLSRQHKFHPRGAWIFSGMTRDVASTKWVPGKIRE